MAVQLNHTIVHARDAEASAAEWDITIEHCAFLVSEREFDEIFGRIQERDLPYWATPIASVRTQPRHPWLPAHRTQRSGAITRASG